MKQITNKFSKNQKKRDSKLDFLFANSKEQKKAAIKAAVRSADSKIVLLDIIEGVKNANTVGARNTTKNSPQLVFADSGVSERRSTPLHSGHCDRFSPSGRFALQCGQFIGLNQGPSGLSDTTIRTSAFQWQG